MLLSAHYSSSPRRRGLTIACFFVTIVLLASLAALDRNEDPRAYALPFGLGTVISGQGGFHAVKPCTSDLEYLRREEYNLTRRVVFQKRCVQGVRDHHVDREVVADADGPLVGEGRILDLDNRCKAPEKSSNIPSCEPIHLDVPRPFPDADFSDMIFGVASTLTRLQDSLPQFSHWLANTGARLLATVIDKNITDSQLASLTAQYKNHGINLVPVRPWSGAYDVNEQHFTIIRELVWHATPDTPWAVIIDDDTFFPSPYSITRLLSAHDPTTPIYLGGLSENQFAVDFHGFMAFGGAGVFMSMPLVKQLEPKIDECLEESTIREGDGLFRYCIYNKTNMKLTVAPGLHQFDMVGDFSGFYELGQFPLSLHHWKSWHFAPVDKMARVVDFCGGCFLQRWRFGADTVFANGYSISVYEDGIEHGDLSRMEATWDGALAFEGTLGPMRNKTEEGQKKSYRLIDSEKVGENLRQVYVRRAPDAVSAQGDAETPVDEDAEVDKEDEPELMDEVVEIWWEWPRA